MKRVRDPSRWSAPSVLVGMCEREMTRIDLYTAMNCMESKGVEQVSIQCVAVFVSCVKVNARQCNDEMPAHHDDPFICPTYELQVSCLL